MTDPETRDPLAALSQRWREYSKYISANGPRRASTYRHCADELDEVRAQLPSAEALQALREAFERYDAQPEPLQVGAVLKAVRALCIPTQETGEPT